MNKLNGQLTMFDLPEGKKRPCDYSFRRYIGQNVMRWRTGKILRITEIKSYYTYLDDGSVGTPYDICALQEET